MNASITLLRALERAFGRFFYVSSDSRDRLSEGKIPLEDV
jgi:hypothetical protein